MSAHSALASRPESGARSGGVLGRLGDVFGLSGRIVRYGAVSLLALGISELTLLGLLSRHVDATLAAVVANLAGTLPSYLLSRYWIWREAERSRAGRQVLLYWLTSLVCLVVSSVGTGVVGELAPARGGLRLAALGLAYLLLSLVLWIAKFALYQFVIFRSPAASQPWADEETDPLPEALVPARLAE